MPSSGGMLQDAGKDDTDKPSESNDDAFLKGVRDILMYVLFLVLCGRVSKKGVGRRPAAF